jgi:NitT/TauT family transport system substrate-binding protein
MKNIFTHRLTMAAASLSCAALALTACSSAAGTTEGQPDQVTLMTDVAFLPKHAPFFSAVAQGFFEQEGIALEIMPGSGSNNTVTSVDTGRVDFGWADYGVTILNKGEGASVKQINLVQGSSAYATLALPDSGIADWSDLKGKTVATEGAGAMTALWPLAVEAAGLEESDVEVVHASGESKIPGLLAKQWDANISLFVSDEPVLIGEGVQPAVLKWADIGVSYYGNGILTSEDKIQNDPDLVKRFNSAMQRGYLWACQNPQEAAADFAAEVSGFAPETVEVAIEGQCSLSWTEENEELGFGSMSDEGTQAFIDVAGEYLGLENPQDLDASSVYTNEFLSEIKPGEDIASPEED